MPSGYNRLTPVPTPCGGAPTPVMPDTGLYATPMPPGECNFNNHECNPFCTLNNWEGAEMWKQISTVGYRDIIVEFDLSASISGDLPHGIRPHEQGYNKDNGFRIEENDDFRPYQTCNGNFAYFYQRCPDTGLIDEVFTVCYTSEYDSPYDEYGVPVFHDPLDFKIPKGISKWHVAKMITRRVLMEDYPSLKKVVLVFSSHESVNNIPSFGIWFRAQLDSIDDSIKIHSVRLFGKRI